MSDRDKVLEELRQKVMPALDYAARIHATLPTGAMHQKLSTKEWLILHAEAEHALKGGDSIAPEQGSHDWHDYKGLTCCRVCGIVQRRDGQNKPCRGRVKISLRDSPASPPQPSTREDVERDAMRYRYLRKVYYWDAEVGDRCAEVHDDYAKHIDESIDAAMNSGQSQNVGGIE